MKTLNLGQLTNTLANVGVLVGLFFLVLEVRQNTRAIQNETDVAIWTAAQGTTELITDPEIAEMLVRARAQGWETFSAVEQFRLGALWGNVIDRFELQFRLYERNGEVLQREDWVFPEQLLEQPSFRTWWESYKSLVHPAARSYLDRYLSD